MNWLKNVVSALVFAAVFLLAGGIIAYRLELSSAPKKAAQEPGPCIASQLSASSYAQGTTGSLAGSAMITNISTTTCEIAGTPSVEFVDASGAVLAVESRALARGVEANKVVLQEGESAFAQIIWANWCGAESPQFVMRLALPDSKEMIRASSINMPPRCDAPEASSTVSVGPFIFSSGSPLVPIGPGE